MVCKGIVNLVSEWLELKTLIILELLVPNDSYFSYAYEGSWWWKRPLAHWQCQGWSERRQGSDSASLAAQPCSSSSTNSKSSSWGGKMLVWVRSGCLCNPVTGLCVEVALLICFHGSGTCINFDLGLKSELGATRCWCIMKFSDICVMSWGWIVLTVFLH